MLEVGDRYFNLKCSKSALTVRAEASSYVDSSIQQGADGSVIFLEIQVGINFDYVTQETENIKII